MAGLKKDRVLDAVRITLDQFKQGIRVIASVDDYEAQAVSKKILRIVLSYTDYINRTVWRKII
jgi:UDP-N-acetylglucosamine 2-epimerase (non-hydrolysing)